MPFIKYADTARADLSRLHAFIAQYDTYIADKALETIIAGIGAIQAQPRIGTPLRERPHVRKLVIDFGASGYLVFHKYYEQKNLNLVARIIHQKEWYDQSNIGRLEEMQEDSL